MSVYKFPKGFRWGSATSSHQVEGGNHNDWTEWEQSVSRSDQLKKDGKDPAEFISGKACDSYNRYEEDFDIVRQLGQNIHRLSIEWSRIEPREGVFDSTQMDHYVQVIKSLMDRGIEPMVTLWHFTNPVWFAENGGFLNNKSPAIFERYVRFVAENLKDKVSLWITFNEATTVYSPFGYLKSFWPPQYKSILKWRRVNRNLIQSHIRAYKAIRSICKVMSHNVMVGIVENNVYVPEARSFWANWWRTRYKKLRNFYFFNKARGYYDFIGLNYYHMDKHPVFYESQEIVPRQTLNKDMGWELYPPGIYSCLKDLQKYNRPIYITENGISDSTDGLRLQFIKEHLLWVQKAIGDGVDVRGYMYWSLLDNFEWHHGYGPRFGLVEVDFKTFQRKIRASAFEYAKICKENQLIID